MKINSTLVLLQMVDELLVKKEKKILSLNVFMAVFQALKTWRGKINTIFACWMCVFQPKYQFELFPQLL